MATHHYIALEASAPALPSAADTATLALFFASTLAALATSAIVALASPLWGALLLSPALRTTPIARADETPARLCSGKPPWGLLGDPSDKQLVLTSVVGSGFITTDNTEYVMLELGAGGTYNLTETLQANATLALTVRNRKHMSFGPNMYAGVRYLFD